MMDSGLALGPKGGGGVRSSFGLKKRLLFSDYSFQLPATAVHVGKWTCGQLLCMLALTVLAA